MFFVSEEFFEYNLYSNHTKKNIEELILDKKDQSNNEENLDDEKKSKINSK